MSEEQTQEYVTWLCWPQDVINTLKVLIAEYRNGGRPPLRQSAIRKAYRILGMRIGQDEGYGAQCWYLNKFWRQRLECAGLDPDTLEVRDARRWRLAWRDLANYRFRVTGIENALAMGEDVALEDAMKPHIAKIPKRKSGEKKEIKTHEQRVLDDRERGELAKRYGGG